MAHNRYRTKLCRNFALGHCPQGDQCKYLHSTNLPSSQTYSMMSAMRPPLRGPQAFDTPFAYVPSAPPMMWSGPSNVHGIDMGNRFAGWNFPMLPSVSAASPNSSQLPQFRPLSWRTTLCRHFVKNQGWCPLGDECGYIHDFSLAAHAANDVRFAGGNRPTGGRAGTKHSHCWAYVQGLCRVKDCPYLHPVAVSLFVPHTPCLAWPNCTRGALCAYKHPEPLIPKAPAMPSGFPLQIQPPTPVAAVPSGTVQFHGTTYFPVKTTHQAPAPPPSTLSSPQFSWNYSAVPSLVSGHSPYSNDSMPFQSPAYETVSSLPPPSGIPRAYMDPAADDAHSPSGVSVSALHPGLGALSEAAAAAAAGALEGGAPRDTEDAEGDADADDPFPYRPLPGQRMGHARRVSVTLKSKSKEESDAVVRPASPSPDASARRQSWMGHRQRDDPAHRSWPRAPDFLAQPRSAHSQSLQLLW